jgi:cell division protein DivIC
VIVFIFAKKIIMLRVNPFKPLWRKLPISIRNRYYLVLIFFGIWMLFIDKHDLWTQFRLNSTMSKLQEDKIYYEAKIEEIKADQRDIEQHKEKFAREKYFMSKANEDVFIIEEKK